MALLEMANGFMEWSHGLADTFGYFGIFAVSFLGAASLFFPAPAFAVIFIFGAILNPWLVGFFAALGATLGELIGYIIGLGGSKVLRKRKQAWFDRAQSLAKKYRFGVVIFAFAATPLPDDITGILGGTVKYDLKKFLVASFLGKLVLNLALALGGFYGIGFVLGFFGGA